MNDDTPEASQELSAVLEDVRRHLLWQEEAAGRVLLMDAKAAAELQRSAPSLRARLARATGMGESSAPARPAASASASGAMPERGPVSPPGPEPKAPLPPRPAIPASAPAMASPRPLAAMETPRQGAAAPVAHPEAAAPRPPLAARAPAARPVGPASTGTLLEVPRASPAVVGGERPTLDQVRRELGDCQRCKLCSGRKNIVFGTGNPRAELVFVGEGPGEQEDLQGVPFVGAAGALLTKMIEAMGFGRDDVYICNVVKCRPPGNRNPEPDEIAACEPFLRAQLAAIQPRVVVALGKFAAQTLLRDSTPITRMRGQWRVYEGIQLMPTFHPAYLLRNPAEKRNAWADLQAVMKVFGKNPGSRT
ncbi:uracil-DNA glycosylase [Myxococcus stipitatus]|uniref:uracil-DNA glycosylase n=1 Tax=Myxococcus stipitatus TaxID=83455 RepID=UPI000317DFBB|nr:uracil-DNA glycosylase [Myxococcus stipitatus]